MLSSLTFWGEVEKQPDNLMAKIALIKIEMFSQSSVYQNKQVLYLLNIEKKITTIEIKTNLIKNSVDSILSTKIAILFDEIVGVIFLQILLLTNPSYNQPSCSPNLTG